MIAFVHIGKTAGSTMKFVLRNSFGLRHCDVLPTVPRGIFSEVDLHFARKIYPGLRSIAGHSLIHPSAHLSENINLFTFVRDPVMRCASLYQRKMLTRRRGEEKVPFEEFIQNEWHRNRQTKYIAGAPDLEKAKEELEKHFFFVGLTERFDESLRIFKQLCPYPVDIRFGLPRNPSPDNTIKKHLLENSRSHDLIKEANDVDLQLYDYVRDVLYPNQLKKVNLAKGGINDERLPENVKSYSYRLCRSYNVGIYRQLVKLRRRLTTR